MPIFAKSANNDQKVWFWVLIRVLWISRNFKNFAKKPHPGGDFGRKKKIMYITTTTTTPLLPSPPPFSFLLFQGILANF